MDEKLKWETPKLQCLSTKQAESGDVYPTEIATTAGPS